MKFDKKNYRKQLAEVAKEKGLSKDEEELLLNLLLNHYQSQVQVKLECSEEELNGLTKKIGFFIHMDGIEHHIKHCNNEMETWISGNGD